jgi:DNA-binding NtrC family response regulator
MPKNILIADDDAAMLDVYARLFAGLDYSISTATSFAEAARLIDSRNYDLLITDLMLGDGMGTDLIKLFEAKQAGARSLLVSGSLSILDPQQLPPVVIEKPFKAEVFISEVTKVLSEAR